MLHADFTGARFRRSCPGVSASVPAGLHGFDHWIKSLTRSTSLSALLARSFERLQQLLGLRAKSLIFGSKALKSDIGFGRQNRAGRASALVSTGLFPSDCLKRAEGLMIFHAAVRSHGQAGLYAEGDFYARRSFGSRLQFLHAPHFGPPA